jgi:hypothetical protein
MTGTGDEVPSDEDIDRIMLKLAEARDRVRTSAADEAYRFRNHGAFFSAPEHSVLIERSCGSCATSSPIANGMSSNRCSRTGLGVSGVWMTGALVR